MNPTTPQIGTWLSLGSPVVAELAALSGFAWALLDLEHGCESEAAIPGQLRAMRGSSMRGIVRVGAPHTDLIARALDWGADGIMVPHVDSADEAAAIVKAAHYAPKGSRGFSRSVRAHNYGLRAPDVAAIPTLMAQIESVKAVRNAKQIASLDGMNVLFVGPADLQFDLDKQNVPSKETYEECLRAVVEAARSAGKTAGILLRDLGGIGHHLQLGFTWVAIESDLSILRKAYQLILTSTQSSKPTSLP